MGISIYGTDCDGNRLKLKPLCSKHSQARYKFRSARYDWILKHKNPEPEDRVKRIAGKLEAAIARCPDCKQLEVTTR